MTASNTNALGFSGGTTYTFNGTPTYNSGNNDFSFVGTSAAPDSVNFYTLVFEPTATLSNSTSSGQSITVDTSGDSLTAELIANTGSGRTLSNSTFATVNATAVVTAPVTSGGGGSTGVPFEVPGGATIPVFGSILALGAMRKFKTRVATFVR